MDIVTRFDRCLCCFSKKISAVACTIIMFLFSFFGALSDIQLTSLYASVYDIDSNGLRFHKTVDYIYLIGIIGEVLSAIVLILLLIGIFTKKIKLMKPFYIVYLLYIISLITEVVYFIVDNSKNEPSEMDVLYTLLNYSYIISIIISVIYYITIVNYIHNTEKEQKEFEQLKSMESPN